MSVESLLAKTRREIIIDDERFIVRNLSGAAMFGSIGHKALGILQARAKEGQDLDDPQQLKDGFSLMREVLGAVMVSPKLGDTTDPDADVITFKDLGDFAPKLYADVMSAGKVEDEENFTGS